MIAIISLSETPTTRQLKTAIILKGSTHSKMKWCEGVFSVNNLMANNYELSKLMEIDLAITVVFRCL